MHAEGRWHSGCLGLEDREAAQALHTRLEALDRLEEQRMEACNGLEEALYSAKETVDIEDDTHKVDHTQRHRHRHTGPSLDYRGHTLEAS